MTQACFKCGADRPLSDFYPDKSKHLGVHGTCKECVKADRRARYNADPPKYNAQSRAYYQGHREEAREQQRRLRSEVLYAYGDACACCGETQPDFLAVDHVNNDGESHRRQMQGYGRAIYRWLKKNGFPQDGRFQLLCHNCNMAKGLYGSCPHGRGVGVYIPRRATTREFAA